MQIPWFLQYLPDKKMYKEAQTAPPPLPNWMHFVSSAAAVHMIIRLLDLFPPSTYHGVVKFFLWRFSFGHCQSIKH